MGICKIMQWVWTTLVVAFYTLVVRVEAEVLSSQPFPAHNPTVHLYGLSKIDIHKCPSLCADSSQCTEWLLFPSKQQKTEHTEAKAREFDCYLLSKPFTNFHKSLPTVSVESPSAYIRGSRGTLCHTDMTTAGVGEGCTDVAPTRLLLRGPLVVDSSTLLNFPQHFTSRCSYTVSLWVWLWRPQQGEGTDKVILTTKAVQPSPATAPPVLPAIVYNVGVHPDKFFFAATQGKRHKEYLGLHRGQVRYHQWIHLALTVEGNVLRAYQDGELLDSVHYSSAELPLADRCAYADNMHVQGGGGAGNSSLRARPSAGEAYYQRLLSDPFAAHVNNTVMYVGSQPMAQGRHSMVGMVAGLTVVRNHALSDEGVRALSEQTRPAPSHALQALLRQHGIPSLEGICPVPLAGDSYRQREWGMCPEVLCGPVCVDETQYLALPATALANAGSKLTAEAAAPDIGHPDGADALDPYDEGKEGAGDAVGTEVGAGGEGSDLLSAALVGGIPFLGPLGAVVWLLQDLLTLALVTVFDRPASPMLAAILDEEGSEPKAARRGKASGQRRAADTVADGSARARKAQALYRSAMSALSAQRLEASSKSPREPLLLLTQSDDTGVGSSGAVTAGAGVEEAQALLALAAWMAEDATAGRWDPRDAPWNFKGSPLLAQPIHLALGYRQGYGRHCNDCWVPWEELRALTSNPEDSYLLGHVLRHSATASALLGDPALVEGAQLTGSTADRDEPRAAGGSHHQQPGPSLLLDEDSGRDSYQFTVDESGEVRLLDASVAQAAALVKTAAGTESTLTLRDWLHLFANVTSLLDTASPSRDPPAALKLLERHGVDIGILTELRAGSAAPSLESSLALSSSESAGSSSLTRKKTETDVLNSLRAQIEDGETGDSSLNCQEAAAYYFPVTQYVAAQYGFSHSGAGPLEEVRLMVSGGAIPQGHGEEDELHQHTEAEAHDGNPHAQTWLAKKLFWGLGGVQRDELAARRWFERAAEQNDAEGLYNVGIFHNNGQAGLPRNEERALQYFLRAADHPVNPFPMAMNTVGNHYLYSETQRNYTKAMHYFLKAAALRSDEAHFSLAMIYREGLGCPKDLPRSVAHLAVAASWGHLRALNFLAHALYDGDSWLAQHGREQHQQRRTKAMAALLTGAPTVTVNFVSHNSSAAKNTSAATAAADSLLHSSLVFDAFELIKVYLPGGEVVPLPYPLGNPDGSCEAALPLLKHMAEMSYRPRDVIARANRMYLRGNYTAAKALFDEAADLGVWAAQENSAFIAESLLPRELCAPVSAGASEKSPDGTSVQNECERMLRESAAHRWAQLARAGEPRAMRRVAELLLSSGSNGTQLQAVQLLALASEQGDAESLLRLGWLLYEGTPDVPRNRSAAEALFAAAMSIEMEAEGGLGLLDEGGEGGSGQADLAVSAANLTDAERRAQEEAAVRRHQFTRRWHVAGYASPTTGGAAPALAMAVVYADRALDSWGFNTSVGKLQASIVDFADQWLPVGLAQWIRSPAAGDVKQGGVAGGLFRWYAAASRRFPQLVKVMWELIIIVLVVLGCRLAYLLL